MIKLHFPRKDKILLEENFFFSNSVILIQKKRNVQFLGQKKSVGVSTLYKII